MTHGIIYGHISMFPLTGLKLEGLSFENMVSHALKHQSGLMTDWERCVFDGENSHQQPLKLQKKKQQLGNAAKKLAQLPSAEYGIIGRA